jgi:exoribonuclease R
MDGARYLPEALSAGWCSLKPGEDRPCLAARIWIDADGAPRKHRFTRAGHSLRISRRIGGKRASRQALAHAFAARASAVTFEPGVRALKSMHSRLQRKHHACRQRLRLPVVVQLMRRLLKAVVGFPAVNDCRVHMA